MRSILATLAASSLLAWGCTVTSNLHSGAEPAAVVAAPPSAGGAAAVGGAQCTAPRVFLDDGFQGEAHDLPAGRHDRANLEAMGIQNDSIRSVCVPPGWRVTLHEDEGFTGRTMDLTTSAGNLGDFAQSATAIVVQPR